MALSEEGWFDRVPIELLASDASPKAVEKARQGVYTARAFRNLPSALREKYFIAGENRWTVSPDLHRRVTYDVVNLVSEHEVQRHVSAPIIFCRNVFIYFSDHSIRRVLSLFDRGMPSPAYLCVGVSESLLRRSTAFDLREIGGAFIYCRDSTTAAAEGARRSGLERIS
jgi:chemotaxis protein methyltransferase CheR